MEGGVPSIPFHLHLASKYNISIVSDRLRFDLIYLFEDGRGKATPNTVALAIIDHGYEALLGRACGVTP